MLADDLKGLHEPEWQTENVADQIETALALQSADGNEFERKPGLGNDVFLETFLRPDKYDATGRIARDIFAGDRDRGVDVSPRPAPRNHQCRHARRSQPRPQVDCCERF